MFGPKGSSLERLSRTQGPIKGQFNFFDDSLRPKIRTAGRQQVSTTGADVHTESGVGLVSRCVFEGGMHIHMFLHAPELTQPSHRNPGSAMSVELFVGNVTNKAAKRRQPW